MTSQEKKFILDLSLKQIELKDFASQFPGSLNKKYILYVLEKAYIEKNSEDVTYSLLLGFLLNIFCEDFVQILCKLILESWHYKHEDIAWILQQLRSPESVDALYKTALAKFDYLNYDDSYALASKCIHALGDINSEYSKQKLMLLAATDIPVIKEKAEKELRVVSNSS